MIGTTTLVTILLLSYSGQALESFVSYERNIVRQQLGYLPINFVKVSAWKENGDDNRIIPVAIQTYPLNGGARRRRTKSKISKTTSESESESDIATINCTSTYTNNVQSPFPTLFWLTDPDISKAVANLERRGYVQIFEDEISCNPKLAYRLLQCHEEYAELRWNSLTVHDRFILMQQTSSSSSLSSSLQRIRNMMELSGISGTNITKFLNNDNNKEINHDLQTTASQQKNTGISSSYLSVGASSGNKLSVQIPPIKCLHAHYAHYRSTFPSRFTSTSTCHNHRSESSSIESASVKSAMISAGALSPVPSTESASSYTFTTNPVGELIHQRLQREYPNLVL